MPDHSIPRPVVLFDAVGTLIYPEPAVADAYQTIAARHGSRLSREVIKQRFTPAYRRYFVGESQDYGRVTDEATEREKWRQLVSHIFDADFSESLFDDLWQHFSLPDSWGSYPEARSTIEQLLELGFPVGVASNFDQRIVPVMTDHFPALDPENIFWSTRLGFAKPDVRFYVQISRELSARHGRIRPLMIGDHWHLDVETPRRAGWSSIWKPTEQRLPPIEQITGYFFRRT